MFMILRLKHESNCLLDLDGRTYSFGLAMSESSPCACLALEKGTTLKRVLKTKGTVPKHTHIVVCSGGFINHSHDIFEERIHQVQTHVHLKLHGSAISRKT